MGNESANMENMYEGKDIGIILDKKNLDNFVIREFVLNENINEHQNKGRIWKELLKSKMLKLKLNFQEWIRMSEERFFAE